jgi:tetratricopeptide (TPR) repeat protein
MADHERKYRRIDSRWWKKLGTAVYVYLGTCAAIVTLLAFTNVDPRLLLWIVLLSFAGLPLVILFRRAWGSPYWIAIAVVLSATVFVGTASIVRRTPQPVPEAAKRSFEAGRAESQREPVTHTTLKEAKELYERAIESHPAFPEAHLELSILHHRIYMLEYDKSDERLRRGKDALETAEQLDPKLPSLPLGRAYRHYWGYLDYARAETEFQDAIKRTPHDPRGHAGLGYIRRRQGQWNDALKHLRDAARLDSLRADPQAEVAHTLFAMHCYAHAITAYERALKLVSRDWPIEMDLARAVFRRYGRTAETEALLERLPEREDPDGAHFMFEVESLLLLDRLPDALARLARADTLLYQRQGYLGVIPLLRGVVYERMGRHAESRRAVDSSRVLLEHLLAEGPPDPVRIHERLAIAHAILGDGAKALEHGAAAVDGRTSDALELPGARLVLAEVYMRLGRGAEAIDLLQELVRVPAGPSPRQLRHDPTWQRLRSDPRFQALVQQEQKCAAEDAIG